MIAPRNVLVIVTIIAALVSLSAARVGDLGLFDSLVAIRHQGLPFDSGAWRSGSPDTRGQMLADLARGHRLVGVQSSAIVDLLGPSECYIDYDDQPCYHLAFDDAKRRLEFSVSHSDQPGKVLAVSIGR